MAQEEQKHHHKNEEEGPVDYKKKEKNHKHGEVISGVSALAGSGYALHEKHQAKKDPENAHSHKTKAEIAAVAGRGCAGLAFHERHKKKDAKHHQ